MKGRRSMAVPLLLAALLGGGRRSVFAAEPPAFRAPADGRLTAEQVERYIAVQKRTAAQATEQRLDPAKPIVSALTELVTADLSAAKDLGYDVAEYQWVKQRVAEARAFAAPPATEGLVKDLTSAAVKALESRRERTKDPDERARLNREIARWKSGRPEGTPAGPRVGVIAGNRELLERYRDQLDAIVAPDLPAALRGPTPR